MDHLELENALIDFYHIDRETGRSEWGWAKSVRLFVSYDVVDFWIEIYNPQASANNCNKVKITAAHASTVSYTLDVGQTSVEEIDIKLKEFVERYKKKQAKKITKIENILDFVKFKLYERGIKFSSHGGYIIIQYSSPISWYLSYSKDPKTHEEYLTLMLNSPKHGLTYRLDGCLADPSSGEKLMSQVMDIITYFKGFNEMVTKWGWPRG